LRLLGSFAKLLLRADAMAVGACSNSYAQSSHWNAVMGFMALMAHQELNLDIQLTWTWLSSFSLL